MTLSIKKVNVNGSGQIVANVNDGNDWSMNREDFARQVCDLNGLVGGDGLVYQQDVSPGVVRIDSYRPDGSMSSFSGSGAIAAAACHFRDFGIRTVQVKQPSMSCVVEVGLPKDGVSTCTVRGIDVARLQDRSLNRIDLLVKNLIPRVNGIHMIRIGEELHLAIESDKIYDAQLQATAVRIESSSSTPPLRPVTITFMRRLNSLGGFVRSYSTHGGGLINSSVGVAASAGFLLRQDSNEGELTITSLGGALKVKIDDSRAATAPRPVISVQTRCAVIYDATIDWDGKSLGSNMNGRVDIRAIDKIGDLGDADLQHIDLSSIYVPLEEV